MPNPQAPGPIPEETMPDHLIFDYFTSAESEAAATTPGPAAYAAAPSPPLPPWAQASAPVSAPGSGRGGIEPDTARIRRSDGIGLLSPRAAAAGKPRRHARDPPRHRGNTHQGNTHRANTRPGRVDPVALGSHQDRQPSSSTGRGASGGPGGYPPGPGGEGSGPFGSRGKLILIIAGAVVLVGAAVVAGVLISRSGQPSSTASPSVFFPTPSEPACVGDAQCKSVCDPERKRKRQRFRRAALLPRARRKSCRRRPRFRRVRSSSRCGSTADRTAPVSGRHRGQGSSRSELPTPDGGNSNPIMQASRDTIVYAERWRAPRSWRPMVLVIGSSSIAIPLVVDKRGACIVEPERRRTRSCSAAELSKNKFGLAAGRGWTAG